MLEAEARLLAIHFADIAGMSRVKVVPTRRAASTARNGVGWSSVWAVVTVDDHFAFVPPFDSPSGDVRLLPDLDAAVVLPVRPGWAWAPASPGREELSSRGRRVRATRSRGSSAASPSSASRCGRRSRRS